MKVLLKTHVSNRNEEIPEANNLPSCHWEACLPIKHRIFTEVLNLTNELLFLVLHLSGIYIYILIGHFYCRWFHREDISHQRRCPGDAARHVSGLADAAGQDATASGRHSPPWARCFVFSFQDFADKFVMFCLCTNVVKKILYIHFFRLLIYCTYIYMHMLWLFCFEIWLNLRYVI